LRKRGNSPPHRQAQQDDAALKKANVTSFEKLYTKVHEEIKKNPAAGPKKERKKEEPKYSDKRKTIVKLANGKQYKIDRRLTLDERKKKVQQKIAKATK